MFSLAVGWSACASESRPDTVASDSLAGATGLVRGGNKERAGGCQTITGKAELKVAGLEVEVHSPEMPYQGDLLILHAWDDSHTAWCTRGRICSKATAKGFRVIMPAMGKSIYCRRTYPETREDWKSYPSTTFLTDTLIPALRTEFCLLKEDGYNFVIGVSAGARGAVRLIQEMPDLFVSAAALSGEYDPSLMPRDNIYRGFLGDIDAQPDRWALEENLTRSVGEMRSSLYLGHGMQDDFVPHTQTERLYNVLRREVPDLNVRFNLAPDRGGSYAYWNYEINNIFRFFEQSQADLPEAP